MFSLFCKKNLEKENKKKLERALRLLILFSYTASNHFSPFLGQHRQEQTFPSYSQLKAITVKRTPPQFGPSDIGVVHKTSMYFSKYSAKSVLKMN